MLPLTPLLITVNFFVVALAIGQQQIITFNASAGAFQLAGNDTQGQVLVSGNDNWGVVRAAADLCHDFGRVTGINLSLAAYGDSTTAPVYTFRPPTSNINVCYLFFLFSGFIIIGGDLRSYWGDLNYF